MVSWCSLGLWVPWMSYSLGGCSLQRYGTMPEKKQDFQRPGRVWGLGFSCVLEGLAFREANDRKNTGFRVKGVRVLTS